MEEEFKLTKKLDHLALIMDGNGRWATKRGLPRTAGHKEACKTLMEVVRNVISFKIYCLTIYAFSTENWNRPKDEIDHLFTYLNTFFKKNIDEMMALDVKIRTMGDLSRLPLKTQKTIEKAKEMTKNNKSYILNICLNYGSHEEILRATKNIALDYKNNKLDINKLDSNLFESYLYTNGLPPVDLMIRTSGEERLSNFMLYQLSYSEFVFTPTYFPDFHKAELIECLKEYESRNRRFGGLKNQ